MTTAHAGDAYRLTLSDKLAVRVVEWRDADSTLTDWTALGGDYVVGADGMIAFPYVGAVVAAGKTTAELASALRDGLRQTLGLTDPPDVSIEVAAFGPVYITGAVRTPGAYAFSPGLNVIKVVSLAGGTRAAATADDHDLITLQGTYDVLREQRVRLLVHRARLDAVLAGRNAITVPAEIETVAEVPPLVAAETAEMTALSQQLTDRIGSLDSQQTMLSKTLDSLKQKETVAQGQLGNLQQQLQTAQHLVDTGLTVATRVSSLQTSVADLETRLLDIQTAELKAEQDLSDMAVQRQKASSDQFVQTSQERQQVSAQVAELDLKIAMQERLIVEASGGTAPLPDEATLYSYVILRGGSQIAATETEGVLPGDVVSVGIKPTDPQLDE